VEGDDFMLLNQKQLPHIKDDILDYVAAQNSIIGCRVSEKLMPRDALNLSLFH
jgi:hypothetical protein